MTKQKTKLADSLQAALKAIQAIEDDHPELASLLYSRLIKLHIQQLSKLQS